MNLSWKVQGAEEIGLVESVDTEQFEKINSELNGNGIARMSSKIVPGETLVQVDPRYFRPTEVEILLGDPSKAKEKLGWEPQTSFDELVHEMVVHDLEQAQRDELCKRSAFRSLITMSKNVEV